MIIAVASGKGGTGKTTLAVSLALSLPNVQLLDCDVEEPNAHLFLNPLFAEKSEAVIPVPVIDEEKCTFCGRCKEVCAFNALAVLPGAEGKKGSILFFENLCHGCGACRFLCPQQAITERDRRIGVVEAGTVGELKFAHGRLDIGEAMAPPLVRQLKKQIDQERTVIIDAPPGTSCPVVTSITEADFCLLVSEPTPFGLNDLILAVEVLRKLGIPFGVVLNRADLGDEKTDEYCRQEDITIMMRIPFDKRIAAAYSRGLPLVTAMPEYRQKFEELFQKIKDKISK